MFCLSEVCLIGGINIVFARRTNTNCVAAQGLAGVFIVLPSTVAPVILTKRKHSESIVVCVFGFVCRLRQNTGVFSKLLVYLPSA